MNDVIQPLGVSRCALSLKRFDASLLALEARLDRLGACLAAAEANAMEAALHKADRAILAAELDRALGREADLEAIVEGAGQGLGPMIERRRLSITGAAA
jgi:hypothetical protein